MALDALPAAQRKRATVRTMFDRIAPRYDRLNRVLTAGMDQRWRRAALDAIGIAPGDRVVDLACGTGDLAELARARGARVLGIDFAREMLRGAARRGVAASFVQADAVTLPLATGAATALTCGFALRNFVALPPVLREMARVVAPGGRIALLEVDRPDGRMLRSGHSLYFDRVVPVLGGWLSDRDAYRYLPQSTAYLPSRAALSSELERAGFEAVARHTRLLGAVQIWTAVRRST
jgi:demethylmenaquinone methyltransferase/2-methoxy-6-polyprenyl-1,4-benzoquinol methylase